MTQTRIESAKRSIGQWNQIDTIHLLKVFVRNGKLEEQKFVFSSLIVENGRVVLQGISERRCFGFGDVQTSAELCDGCQEKLWNPDSFDANFRQEKTGCLAGLADCAGFFEVSLHED
jgi:hypothetical protein